VKTAVLCAAYPFFTNVDEPYHYDVVVKIANGVPTTDLSALSTETAGLLWRWASGAYIWPPKEVAVSDSARLVQRAARLSAPIPRSHLDQTNDEVFQPPVYYWLAAAAYRLVSAAGVPVARRLFFVRFTNALFVGLLVLACFRIARIALPARPDLAWTVALAAALFPQDAFHQIGNDAASPTVCAGAIMLLLPAAVGAPGSPIAAVAGGLLAALATLTKWSNLPVVLFVFAATAGIARAPYPRRSIRWGWPALLLLAFLVPVALWGVRSLVETGDFTGLSTRSRLLGWTPLPVAAWFRHPIFSLGGLIPLPGDKGAGFFLFHSIATFWRGEFTWYLRPLRSPVWDAAVFVVSVAGFAASCVLAARRGAARARGAWLFVATCVVFLLQLVYSSIAFDFGECYYPSREAPFVISGRLMLGALPAFLVVLVAGLDALLRPIARWVAPSALIAAGFVLAFALDLAVSRPALGALASLFRP
jgi:hypothetical protein